MLLWTIFRIPLHLIAVNRHTSPWRRNLGELEVTRGWRIDDLSVSSTELPFKLNDAETKQILAVSGSSYSHVPPEFLEWAFRSHRKSVQKCFLVIYLTPSCFMSKKICSSNIPSTKEEIPIWTFKVPSPLPLFRLWSNNTTHIRGTTHPLLSLWPGCSPLTLPLASVWPTPCPTPGQVPCCSGWLCCSPVSHQASASPSGTKDCKSSLRQKAPDFTFPSSRRFMAGAWDNCTHLGKLERDGSGVWGTPRCFLSIFLGPWKDSPLVYQS